jgi:hypothetical protein
MSELRTPLEVVDGVTAKVKERRVSKLLMLEEGFPEMMLELESQVTPNPDDNI